MHRYTLAFLVKQDKVLLLNRNKSPWMGAWNGVGGKIHMNETPLACIVREIAEETGLLVKPEDVMPKGVVTWDSFDAQGSGLYMFVVYLADDTEYHTPRVVDEGILDWKSIAWASDMNNQGIARNIPYFLPTVLEDEAQYEFACAFEGDILKTVKKVKL